MLAKTIRTSSPSILPIKAPRPATGRQCRLAAASLRSVFARWKWDVSKTRLATTQIFQLWIAISPLHATEADRPLHHRRLNTPAVRTETIAMDCLMGHYSLLSSTSINLLVAKRSALVQLHAHPMVIQSPWGSTYSAIMSAQGHQLGAKPATLNQSADAELQNPGFGEVILLVKVIARLQKAGRVLLGCREPERWEGRVRTLSFVSRKVAASTFLNDSV